MVSQKKSLAEAGLIIRQNEPPPPQPEPKKGKKSPQEPLLEVTLDENERLSTIVFGLPSTFINWKIKKSKIKCYARRQRSVSAGRESWNI